MQITVISIWNLHETIFASLYFINHVPFFFVREKLLFAVSSGILSIQFIACPLVYFSHTSMFNIGKPKM